MDKAKGKKPFNVSKPCAVKKNGSSKDASRSGKCQAKKIRSQSLKAYGDAEEYDSDSEFDEDWLHYLNSKDLKHYK